ncbi:MAG: outer membrane protein assembly factor BamD [Acidobacteriota bacterium]|jgi:outer membrane protein assembly factor BamD|nr:outer membrane protein assembly factor BamD [Acidobacteriota bacterium]
MQSRNFTVLVLSAILVFGCGVAVMAQGAGEGTPAQRLEIMRSKLDSLRRSLNSAVASMNAKEGNDKAGVDDPRNRLRGLEQEANSILSEVNDLKSKQERAERVETKDLDRLETSVTDLNTRAQAALQSTASEVRNGPVAPKQTKKKKKGKLFGLFGGGGDNKYAELTDTVAPGRDRELFEVAAKEVRKGSYDTGRLLFNTIITTYPDSPFLPLSKLAIADSFYLEGTTSGLIQAAQAYQDWLTFFPTDPLSDRVMLKVAEAEMRQMGLADRDVTRARKAEQRLKAILQQFPKTPLRPEIELRLTQVQENLGVHSLRIARFYQDKFERGNGGLKGAQSRLREILEKYPNFSYRDEVLFRQGWLYIQEEEPDEAAKYFQQVVRDFPNSDYVEKAKEELTKIGAPIPDPDPIKLKIPKPERPGMMSNLLTEITGSADVTVNSNGVLISKSSKEGGDLIDEALAHQGQIQSLTPSSIQQKRQPPRTFQQGTTPAPGKPPATNSTPGVIPSTQPATTPATTPSTAPLGTKP